jgi:hypothetical protein
MKLKKFVLRKKSNHPQSLPYTNAYYKNSSIDNKNSSNVSRNGILLRELNVSSEIQNIQQYTNKLHPSKSACELYKGHTSARMLLNNITLREEIGKNIKRKTKPLSAKEIEQYHKRVFSNRERKLKAIPLFKNKIKNSAYTSLNELIHKTCFMEQTVKFMFNQVIDYKFKIKKKFYDEELMNNNNNKRVKWLNKSRNGVMCGLDGGSKKENGVSGVYVIKKNNSVDNINVTLHSKYPKLNSSAYSYKCKQMIYF